MGCQVFTSVKKPANVFGTIVGSTTDELWEHLSFKYDNKIYSVPTYTSEIWTYAESGAVKYDPPISKHIRDTVNIWRKSYIEMMPIHEFLQLTLG